MADPLSLFAPAPPNLAEQIACVRREIAMRRRVYPRWQADGKISAEKARHELACMEAALATLEALAR